VLNTGGPVTMPWLRAVPAVLQFWYPGQENGHALARVLTGDANPSGKLPLTFPKSPGQAPTAEPGRYPARQGVYEYSEGLEIGYRGYDARGRRPLFPFGFGLSYTAFALSDLAVVPAGDGVAVHVRVTNTGTRAGVETPQVYLSFPPSAGEPPRSLVAYTKVSLEPGQAADVALDVPAGAFSHWDSAAHRWAATPGDYRLSVGTSARDLPLSVSLPR
jgi:beta-glucosidase